MKQLSSFLFLTVETDAGLMTFEYDGTGTLISRTAESGGVITKTEFFGQ